MARQPDTDRRVKAFDLYKKFHGNLSRVSTEPGMPSMQTLIRWKKEEGWHVSLAENQSQLREFAALLGKGSGLPALENDIHQLKILECLERYCGEAVQSGSIQPEDWKDVLDTLRFVSNERRLLTGKPTGRTETLHSVAPENSNELYKLVEEAQRIIRKYGQPVIPPSVGTEATPVHGNPIASTASETGDQGQTDKGKIPSADAGT